MLKWIIRKLTGLDKRGRNPLVNNFKVEGWKDAYIFIRELLQNVLDNRLTPETAAKVDIRILKLQEEKALNQYRNILSDIEPHLRKAEKGYIGDLFKSPRLLVIKEEGTTGFSGEYKDSDADSDWANFFFGAAKEVKSGSKNGRAGQGKISYYMLSKARSLFVVTKRSEDKSLLMMGNANFSETHSVDNLTYDYSGYYSVVDNGQPLPTDNEHFIREFCLNFGVDIDEIDSGNVYFIPAPSEELDDDTSIAIQATIQDFFYPVLKGRLEVTTKQHTIYKDNLSSIYSLYRKEFEEKSKSAPTFNFLKFIEGTLEADYEKLDAKSHWKGRKDGFEELFSEEQLKRLREKFNQEEVIAVKVPIRVARKGADAEVQELKVYVQRSDKIDNTEEAYIRTDLFISNETKLKPVSPRNAFGLVVADADSEILAEFLANAEVASHLSWNSKESKVEDNFVNIEETLRKVRASLPNLFNFLLDNDDSEDDKFMLGFLSVPKEGEKSKHKKKSKKKESDGPTNEKPERPIISRNPVVELEGLCDGDGFALRPTNELTEDELPLVIELEVVYDLLQSEGDPFKHHSHFDFDFSQLNGFDLKSTNCEILANDLQFLRLKISSINFEFSVKGFNKNIPLRMRYKLPKISLAEEG